MARVKGNLILHRVSGKLGPLVVRQCRTGTVLSISPKKTNAKPTERQKEVRLRFKLAAIYAKSILNDPVKREALRNRVKKNSPLFPAAVAEYLRLQRDQSAIKQPAPQTAPAPVQATKPSYLVRLWISIKGGKL